MEKLLSVIVPVYNAEKWLNRCIDSILEQSYKNFELILVNDGSKDASGEICDDYAKKDQRITVIHKANAGVSEARNTGIEIAQGDYIIFIDSDDAIVDGYFASAVAGMETGVDWFICGAKEILFSGGNIVSESSFQLDLPQRTTILDLYSAVDNGIASAFVNCPCFRAYKTDIIKENALSFDPSLSLGEDIYFNLSYAKFAKEIFIDKNEYYLYYRENTTSLTKRFFETKYEDSIKIYDEWRRTITELGASEDTLKRFENLYLRVMFSNIVHVYTHTKDRVKRKEMIKKVINNEWVRKSKTYGDGTFVVRMTTFFIVKKISFMVSILFSLKFGFSKNIK